MRTAKTKKDHYLILTTMTLIVVFMGCYFSIKTLHNKKSKSKVIATKFTYSNYHSNLSKKQFHKPIKAIKKTKISSVPIVKEMNTHLHLAPANMTNIDSSTASFDSQLSLWVDFMERKWGFNAIEIQAVEQQQKNHLAELQSYDYRINQGSHQAQVMREEAILNHQQWMIEHIGYENYQQLLSL